MSGHSPKGFYGCKAKVLAEGSAWEMNQSLPYLRKLAKVSSYKRATFAESLLILAEALAVKTIAFRKGDHSDYYSEGAWEYLPLATGILRVIDLEIKTLKEIGAYEETAQERQAYQ